MSVESKLADLFKNIKQAHVFG